MTHNHKELFEQFWTRYQWLNRGKNHKESAQLAFNETIAPLLVADTLSSKSEK